jgi:hypothetical protein
MNMGAKLRFWPEKPFTFFFGKKVTKTLNGIRCARGVGIHLLFLPEKK